MWVFLVGIGFSVGFLLGDIFRTLLTRKRRATGTILVNKREGKTVYSLELDGDVDKILESKDTVLFVVSR